MSINTQRERLLKLFESESILRARTIADTGIDPKTVQRMVEKGELARIGRGLYTLPTVEPSTHYTLAQAHHLVELGVVCLLSALSFHEIGTQSPRSVWMAIPRTSRVPNVSGNPIKIIKFSGAAYTEGIADYEIDGVTVPVYNIPKTVADCFKYRNKLGIDIAIEALRDVVRDRRSTNDELLKYAEVCRVRNVMIPYLESIV